MHWRLIIALVSITLLAAGCSELEPKTGTKVVFASIKPMTRQQIADASRYLTLRGRLLLGVSGPRIQSVTDSSITLLLPGEKIARSEIEKLIEPNSLELYHLSKVATTNHPARLWKMKVPARAGGSYLFSGPNATLIDSRLDPKSLLKEVVGVPTEKPVLTGDDILPSAAPQQASEGWSVLVKFTEDGARRFHDFTKHNIGEYLAVFYNGRMISAPLIKEAISDGQAYITGFGSGEQARAAVHGINAGTLPINLEIVNVEYY